MLIKDIPFDSLVNQVNQSHKEVSDPLGHFIDQYIKSGRRKALYIHTPFCVSKCRYCKWQSSQLELPEELDFHYEQVLAGQVKKYHEIFDKIIFNEVYLGGGTPTIVPASTMGTLFDTIPNFDKIKNKCMEASPDTLTKHHIKLFQKYNFYFLSIGVQSLNYHIMGKHGRRYISRQELLNLSHYLNEQGIYFNFDMICYLDTGDLRDVPDFEKDLDFIMNQCKPSSITIHQEYWSFQTFEKTNELMRLIRQRIDKDPKWVCVNSDLVDEDVRNDTMYRAEYRIVSRNYDYMHHLWDKYNLNLKEDYDVLTLGSTKRHPLFSFVGDMMYQHEQNIIYSGPHTKFDEWMYRYLREIRERKGLKPL